MPEAIRVATNEATAARRRAYFYCVDATDGITPETGEASGQPQISVDGAAYTNTGIGTLTAAGNGDYYADVTQATVNVANAVIRTRYKSSATAESRGSVLVASANWDRVDATLSGIETKIDTVDGVADAILVDTAVIGALGAGLTAVPWNAAWDAEVQSECTDALNAYDPPTDTEMLAAHTTTDALITTVDGVVDSILVDTAFVEKWILGKLVTTDNLNGTLTAVLYDTDNTTPLATWVFTTASGTRAKAT